MGILPSQQVPNVARLQASPDPLRIRFADFELDEANACLMRHGEAVALTPTPFALLCALAREPGRLWRKDALLDAVWGHRFVSESVLKTAISELRLALGDNPRQPSIIETVSRHGYRFIAHTSPAHPSGSVAAPDAGGSPAPPFVGRAAALSRLDGAWQRVQGGQRALVWLAGEPGMGKTTLIDQFVSGLEGVACARGHCVEHFGTAEPYLPVLEALSQLCRADPQLPELLRSVAPTWLMQFPWLCSVMEREALRREMVGVGPERMLREMGELLERYTEQRPLLLVTEDLHWSDRSTVQLIAYLARRRGRIRMMWLASFRVAEVVALDHPLGALRHELRLQRLCDEIMLDPFSETEVADYVALSSPALARDESFVRALHQRTDGVPLFVSSIIDEVIDPTRETRDATAALAQVGVPQGLLAILDNYLARLDGEQRVLLTTAAVCGVEFRLETVSEVIGRDLAEVANACEQMVLAHLWLAHSRVSDGEYGSESHYAFRHALFRRMVYERTPHPVRARLHLQVGVALERERCAGVPVPAAELAMHFDRARQPLAALRYYAEAMEAALLHFSPASALGLSRRVALQLERAPAGAERDALAISLATLEGVAAFQMFGLDGQAGEAFERAYGLLEKLPGHPMSGRLLHGYGYLLSLRGEYARALAVAQRAEALSALANDPQLMLAACIVHSEVLHLQGRTQPARDWLERALAIAESLDIGAGEVVAADPQVMLLGMLAIELLRGGLLEQARHSMRRAQARAAMLRQPMAQLVACWHELLMEVRLGNAERVRERVEDLQALVDEHALALGRTACGWWRGWVEARLGSPRDGHRRIREAFEAHASLGMRAGSSEVLGYAAEALLLAGDIEGAQGELQEALRVTAELGESVYLPQLLLLRAAIARALGEGESAGAAVRSALQEARAQEAPWLELLALVELCTQCEATDQERQALERLVERLPEAEGSEPMRRARALLLPLDRTG
ncbi:AAA family ATPase [Pseudomonas sp. LA21]|uniref:AAA family ATPase n=1 Tax=unclassified Pseudomonas TaxID=196821 RepID=UPI002441D7B0|nr:AAA family ATPase [Pseudomonas sp. LA21]